MKHYAKKLLPLVFIAFLSAGTWAQTMLAPEVQTKIFNSVFEVVVDKIESTNITYEKELPLDRLPFSVRNDKYNSVGTAFLMDDGQFYSASHVFSLYGDTVVKNYYIRNSNGETFKVDKITSLSSYRDFISFTVENFSIPEGSGLKSASDFQLNTTVFSVGNAQGQGVIIRNGMITSQTPEERNGEFNWLRFTAAASPGNSGGPLITEAGDVIGIITMRNETENLNFALPFRETETGKDGKGIVDERFYYALPNLAAVTKYFEFKHSVQLPASYESIHDEFRQVYHNLNIEVVNEMRKEYNPDAPKGFGRSKEFPFFNTAYSLDNPITIYLEESGEWGMGSTDTKSVRLEDNGSVAYAANFGYYMFTITKPDSVSLEDYVLNPKKYMDDIAKVINLNRTVAGERISVTSFGEPETSEKYRDYFGRTWYVNYFPIDFADQMIITFAIPMPTGLYVIYRLSSRSNVLSGVYLDMQFLADHTYTDYYGKLSNWKEYLSLCDELNEGKSDMEKQFKIDCSENELNVTNGLYTVKITPELMSFDDETRISSLNAYKLKDDKIVLENRSLAIYSKPKSENFKFAEVYMTPKPYDDSIKSLNDRWKQLLSRIAPYNGEPYNDESYTEMNTIVYSENDPQELYQFSFELINQNQFEEIRQFADSFMKCLTINN